MRRALLLAALLGAAGPARAQVSPGPLAQPHAALDGLSNCLSCHEAGRELSGRKCLACHQALATRIQAGRGFHAEVTRRGAEPRCASCHSDHNGRPYRLVRWPDNQPKERFDHARAGYQLEGAHQRLRCEDCHRPGLIADAAVRGDRSLSTERTYLGLERTCASCHLDEHRGRTSRTCTDCHTQERWSPAPGFDHDRTDFRLEGRHRGVACAECHTVRRESATGPGGARDTSFVDFRAGRSGAGGCAACHTSPHRQAGRTGRCEACHTVQGWFVLPDSLRSFDHAPIGFPLRGAHAAADCEGCHLSSAGSALSARAALVRANFLRPLGRQRMRFAACTDCHQEVHRAELAAGGQDCVACHDERRFAPTSYTADTHARTRYPLTGAHLAVPCARCHTPLPGAAAGLGRVRFRFTDLSCAGCHQDPHRGQFQGRRCEDCHSTVAWATADVPFDHERTRYPLRGAHTTVRCGACHTTGPGGVIAFRGLPLTCGTAGCHADPHAGQFGGRARGEACLTCHDDTAFKPARFDHATDSDWPLDGSHQRAPCAACHKPQGTPAVVRWRPLPHRCEDCHAAAPGRRP